MYDDSPQTSCAEGFGKALLAVNERVAGKESLGAAPPMGKGYGYKDPQGDSHGVVRISLKNGGAGKSKASFKAKNGSGRLVLGVAAGLAGSTGATIQVISSDSVCLSVPLTDVKRAEAGSFKAK